MTRPAASRLALAQRCVYPWTSGTKWPSRPQRDDAAWGIAVHRLMAEGPQHLRAISESEGVDVEELEAIAVHAEPLLDELAQDTAEPPLVEVGFAFDLAQGTTRRVKSAREARDGEYFGAVDHAYLSASSGAAVVIDWKSGGGGGVMDPGASPQLRALALMAARHFGVTTAIARVGYVTADGIDLRSATLDATELLCVESEFWQLEVHMVGTAMPTPGPWCKHHFCPLAAVCPATTAALEHVTGQLATGMLLAPITSAEQASFVRHRLPILQQWIESRETDLRAFAKREPIPVEGEAGVVWGPVEHDGVERIEASPDAIGMLRFYLGEHAEKALGVEISKASIARAVRSKLVAEHGAKIPRGAIGEAEKGILERLRAGRFLKRGARYTRFETFRRPVEGQPLEMVTYDGPEEPGDGL